MALHLRLELFTWQDEIFQKFMLEILQKLEPRMARAHEIIFNELEDVSEILFYDKGQIDLGYEIDKKKLFKLRFRE